MDSAILIIGIAIMAISYVLFLKDKQKKHRQLTAVDYKELEAIIDKAFLELQEENHKQHKAYINDVNFLQKKLNDLEDKIKKLERYKQFDVVIESDEVILEPPLKNLGTSDIQNTSNVISSFIPAQVKEPDIKKPAVVNEQVIDLYNEGYSVEDIAKRLNIMCGEAQLIIGLYKRTRKQ